VNSTEAFTEQPFVINGASDLLVEVFGTQGQHARSALGVAQLPANAAVEIEMIVEVVE
jgi:enamine deaminase RidA (YjgF/YER057c/UK114 family)